MWCRRDRETEGVDGEWLIKCACLIVPCLYMLLRSGKLTSNASLGLRQHGAASSSLGLAMLQLEPLCLQLFTFAVNLSFLRMHLLRSLCPSLKAYEGLKFSGAALRTPHTPPFLSACQRLSLVGRWLTEKGTGQRRMRVPVPGHGDISPQRPEMQQVRLEQTSRGKGDILVILSFACI